MTTKARSQDKKRFVNIRYDGQTCICEPRDVRETVDGFVGDILDGCDGAVVTDVWMTEDEFEALPEFAGW